LRFLKQILGRPACHRKPQEKAGLPARVRLFNRAEAIQNSLPRGSARLIWTRAQFGATGAVVILMLIGDDQALISRRESILQSGSMVDRIVLHCTNPISLEHDSQADVKHRQQFGLLTL
jgi:hypothetical protein